MPDAHTIQELKERNARNIAFVDSKRSRDGWASYLPAEVPPDARISNEERATLEVYEFLAAPPERYFLYINTEKGLATNFTGATLGRVQLGPKYEVPAFGRPSVRRSVHVWAINGREYVGTYYESSGDYARVKIKKG